MVHSPIGSTKWHKGPQCSIFTIMLIQCSTFSHKQILHCNLYYTYMSASIHHIMPCNVGICSNIRALMSIQIYTFWDKACYCKSIEWSILDEGTQSITICGKQYPHYQVSKAVHTNAMTMLFHFYLSDIVHQNNSTSCVLFFPWCIIAHAL